MHRAPLIPEREGVLMLRWASFSHHFAGGRPVRIQGRLRRGCRDREDFLLHLRRDHRGVSAIGFGSSPPLGFKAGSSEDAHRPHAIFE